MCGTNMNYAAQGALDAYSKKAAPCPKEAAKNFARLMERQLGYEEGHIDPIALRLFIRAYWGRVSQWAHTMHDEE